jgi:hypothetical protein
LEKVRGLHPEAKEKTEVDKQIDQLLDNPDAGLSDIKDEDEDWEPLILEYVFQERVRIMEAFYGPEADTLEDDLALAGRIRVTKDMMALCKKTRPLGRARPNIQPTCVSSV